MNTDKNAVLYEKMAAEQDKFRDWLKMDFVRMRSIFFFRHSSIILLNCSLFLVLTPEIPSSAKIPANCHPS